MLKRLLSLEPVLLHAVIIAVVTLAGIWGLSLTSLGDQLGRSVDVIYPIAVLVGAWWTRSQVSPVAPKHAA
jgi:hypothetical protein